MIAQLFNINNKTVHMVEMNYTLYFFVFLPLEIIQLILVCLCINDKNMLTTNTPSCSTKASKLSISKIVNGVPSLKLGLTIYHMY